MNEPTATVATVATTVLLVVGGASGLHQTHHIKLTALSPSHILRLTPPFVYPFFSFLLFF